MDKKSKSSNDEKKEGNVFIRNKKLFLVLLIVFLGIVAIISVVAFISPDDNNLNISNQTETNISENLTNETSGPKAGYRLVQLAGLKFYAPEKYLKAYDKGDYFDGFVGGKDYDKILKSGDDFDIGHLNSSQLTLLESFGSKKKVNSSDGGHHYIYPNQKIFSIGVYPKKLYSTNFDEMDIFNKNSKKNRTVENVIIGGHNVKIIKTGDEFGSQSVGENETFAYFEVNDKSVLIAFTGVPIDKYLIESFFTLN